MINDPYHIVVSRYNEDISWLDGQRYVKLYDKGVNGNLPNVGRESHTYLYYIVNNYYNLPDTIFFTQAGNDHIHHPIDYFIHMNKNQTHSSNYINTSDGKHNMSDGRVNNWKGDTYPASLNFFEWFHKYVDNNIDVKDTLTWYMNACFSVTKDRILSRSLEYYENLLEQLSHHSNPEVGHYFERSWYYIFNCHKSESL